MSHKNSQENNKTMYGEIVFTRKYISGKCAYMLRCSKSAHAQIAKSATSVAPCHINNVYYLYLLSLCSDGQTIEGGRLQRRLLNCSRLEFQHVYDFHSRIRHLLFSNISLYNKFY